MNLFFDMTLEFSRNLKKILQDIVAFIGQQFQRGDNIRISCSRWMWYFGKGWVKWTRDDLWLQIYNTIVWIEKQFIRPSLKGEHVSVSPQQGGAPDRPQWWSCWAAAWPWTSWPSGGFSCPSPAPPGRPSDSAGTNWDKEAQPTRLVSEASAAS